MKAGAGEVAARAAGLAERAEGDQQLGGVQLHADLNQSTNTTIPSECDVQATASSYVSGPEPPTTHPTVGE